jgi:hypothetical protein
VGSLSSEGAMAHLGHNLPVIRCGVASVPAARCSRSYNFERSSRAFAFNGVDLISGAFINCSRDSSVD